MEENKDIKLENITLEWYVNYFNNVLYPLNYPYKLYYGIGSYGINSLYICIQIHTEEGLIDAFKIWGKDDKDVINAFEKLEYEHTLKCLINK